jgi:hypothetical protein
VRYLRLLKQEAQQAWVKGEFNHQDPFKTAIANHCAVEKATTVERISEFDYEEYATFIKEAGKDGE